MSESTKGMLICGVLGSQAIDTSGEILDVKGADISDLVEGRGQLNYEHISADDKKPDDKGAPGEEWVGRIVFAKKIFSADDCSDEIQLQFWKELELPFIYGIMRLYDAAGSRSAQALAAIIRDHHANKEPILWRFSVEGSTLTTSEDKKILKTSIIRNIALTRKPCNRSSQTRILADPQAPEGFDKRPVKVEKDILEDVLKRSEQHVHPERQRLGAATYIDYNPEITEESLNKTLTAGNTNAAPSTLTGGAALQVEDPSLKRRRMAYLCRKALESWNPEKPLKPHLKAEVPEASDEFIDRFADLVDAYKVGRKDSLLKLGNKHSISRQEVEKSEFIRKFELLSIRLAKALGETQAPDQTSPATKSPLKPGIKVKFRGQHVVPGQGSMYHQETGTEPGWKPIAVLHADQNHLHVIPAEKIGHWTPEDVVRVPRGAEHVQVDEYPRALAQNPVVDSMQHGTHYNQSQEQVDLIHGLDLGKPGLSQYQMANAWDAGGQWYPGINAEHSAWYDHPQGQGRIYVKKANENQHGFTDASREALYHNLGRNFFGLGDHLPTVSHFVHPQTGEEHVAISRHDGEHVPLGYAPNDALVPTRPDHKDQIKAAGQRGELDKLALANLVMGNRDRNPGNWMMGTDGRVKLLDHGRAFSSSMEGRTPTYWDAYHGLTSHEARTSGRSWESEQLHPEAQAWLNKLDPAKLDQHLQANGAPDNIRAQTVKRLQALQNWVRANPQGGKLSAWLAGDVPAEPGYGEPVPAAVQGA